jgi:multiple sugar transport system permease protein
MSARHKMRFEIPAIIMAIFFIFPFYWLLESTTKDNSQLFQGTFVPATPNHFVDNVIGVFQYKDGVFVSWLANSLLYAGLGALAGTFFAAMAGYAFRRYRFTGRKILFILILGFASVPAFATALPLFIVFKNLGLLNTRLSVLIPSTVNVFGVYLMVVYWNQVPDEIFDAAKIDGATDFRIFSSIGLPTILPGATTLYILEFVAVWNNYFLPLIMLSDAHAFPLILGITTIQSLQGFPVYNLMLMGAFLTAIPLLIIFSFLQRYLAPQLTGAIK